MNKKLLISIVLVLFLSLTSVFAVVDDAIQSISYDSNFDDESGNANNPTNSGVTIISSGVQVGNGSGEYSSGDHLVNPTLIQNKASFSICTWVKPDAVSTNQVIYEGWGTGGASGFKIIFRIDSSGNLIFYTYTTAQVGGVTQSFGSAGTWKHVCATYDGTTMKTYLDRDVGGTTYAQTGNIQNSGQPEWWGESPFYASTEFIGDMDQSMIYDRALSQAEVDELYDGGAGCDPYGAGCGVTPPIQDVLTVIGKDVDNASALPNLNVTWDGTTYTNATGNIVSINITAEGGNASHLQNFSVVSTNYFSETITNWNISSTYTANLTQYPYITAYDSFSDETINTFNATINSTLFQTTSGLIYVDYNQSLSVEIVANGYATNTTTHDFTGATNLNRSIVPLPLTDFAILTPLNDSETNSTEISVTWNASTSPSGKAITYNVSTYYETNGSLYESFSTTNLSYLIDISSYNSDDYIVSVTAVENLTNYELQKNVSVFVNRPNFLYFYNQQTGDAISGANITIDLPNFATDVEGVTDSDGKVFFLSFYNDTLQTGNFSILFEDFIGYVTPITFEREFNSLPVNESFNITVTNIDISVFYRSNFTTFDRNATVTIEGLSSQTVSNGSVFIQNATITSGEYRITVSADDYFNEEKTFIFTGQDDLDLNIYMLELNSSNSGTVTLRTVDEFSRLLGDARVILLEYDASTLSYLEVSQCNTDSNGECKFLVETNTKSYKFTASKSVNGNTVTASTEAQIFEDSISGGQVVLFSEETITLTLSSLEQFDINPIQNIIFSSTESFNNVTNQSNIDVSFRSIDGTNLEVCVEYFSIAGGVETSLTGNTFCVTASSGEVTEPAFFTLNRSKEYVAKVYIKSGSAEILLEQYKYQSLDSFAERLKNNATLPFLVLFIWILLIGGGLALKNVPITGVFIIIGTWVIWFFFPSITLLSASVIQTLIGISLVYAGRKKEDFN